MTCIAFVLFCVFTLFTCEPATTTPTSGSCPECGAIQKSGKASCCARGGSWFENCGSAGNRRFVHTWYEGIRACKGRQFRTAVGQRVHGSQPNSNASSDDASMDSNSKAVATTARMLLSTPANRSIPVPDAAVPVNTSISGPVRQFTSKEIAVSTIAMNEPMRSALADMFATTSSHTSVGASTAARAYEQLCYITTGTGMMFLVLSN